MLDLATVDHLLTSTRSVRKRLDLERPVEPELLRRCLEIAMQAPSGADGQRWHFIVISDPTLRQSLADLYMAGFAAVYGTPNPASENALISSAGYLATNFHRVPVQILCCYEGRVEERGAFAQASLYGSILPAAWSLMLALRARGLGSAWTTLHLYHEREAAALLGLPAKLTQAALLPVAYYTGDDFRPARRDDPAKHIHWNGWGRPDDAEPPAH